MKLQHTPIRLAIAMLLLFMAHPVALGATSYYVDAINGSDSNDGTTLATPFRTLAAASAIMGTVIPGKLFVGVKVTQP